MASLELEIELLMEVLEEWAEEHTAEAVILAIGIGAGGVIGVAETLDRPIEFPSKLFIPIEVHVPFLPPLSIIPTFEYDPNPENTDDPIFTGGVQLEW